MDAGKRKIKKRNVTCAGYDEKTDYATNIY